MHLDIPGININVIMYSWYYVLTAKPPGLVSTFLYFCHIYMLQMWMKYYNNSIYYI